MWGCVVGARMGVGGIPLGNRSGVGLWFVPVTGHVTGVGYCMTLLAVS